MAKPLVPDDLWAAVAPLLPPARPNPKGGRPPVPDRAALTGIVFVLKTGIQWEDLPAEMGCWNGCTALTGSTGAGPRWTAPPFRRKGGSGDRPEPDGPRQSRHQAARRRRWPR